LAYFSRRVEHDRTQRQHAVAVAAKGGDAVLRPRPTQARHRAFRRRQFPSREHQAFYIDRCLDLPGQEDWVIVGIGLSGGERGRQKAAQYRTQDCLYSLTIAPPHGEPGVLVIGAQLDYLLASEQPDEVLALLMSPDLRIVTLTITEGGYHVDPDSDTFVTDHQDVAHDLAGNGAPRTVFGFVTEALARRRAAGMQPFTVVSCDNLRHDGEVARTAFVGFASARDPELGALD
jgi:mannitol-1-phosphate/altronate dehydrogenase